MNIVMFTNTYHPVVGGVEKSIETFATEMRRRGHQVLIVAPEYENAEESTETVFRFPAIKHFGGTPYSVKLPAPDDFASRIDAFAPDIIHSHQPFLLGDSALRTARERNVPIVYTNHTFMERYLHWFPVDWPILQEVTEKLPVAYANLVDHVITPTESVAQILRERGVTTPITPIPTGIDADFFASGNRQRFREKFGIGAEQQVIGHLGRLNTEKNLSYLAEVALQLVQQSPEQRRFLLVGEGDAVAEIERLFADNGAQAQLIYAGLQTGQDCADAYAAMDLFLFTSLTDTQGIVLTEAMAAGNPVFALDAPGARDMITHERNGYLFATDISAADFAETVNQILQDEAQLEQYQQAATEDAYKVSIPQCTENTLTLYESLLEGQQLSKQELSTWEKLTRRWETELELIQEKLQVLTD